MNQLAIEVLAIIGAVTLVVFVIWAVMKIINWKDELALSIGKHEIEQMNLSRDISSCERKIRALEEQMSCAMTIKDWHAIQESRLREEQLIKGIKGKKK